MKAEGYEESVPVVMLVTRVASVLPLLTAHISKPTVGLFAAKNSFPLTLVKPSGFAEPLPDNMCNLGRVVASLSHRLNLFP